MRAALLTAKDLGRGWTFQPAIPELADEDRWCTTLYPEYLHIATIHHAGDKVSDEFLARPQLFETVQQFPPETISGYMRAIQADCVDRGFFRTEFVPLGDEVIRLYFAERDAGGQRSGRRNIIVVRRGNLLLKLAYDEQPGYPTFGHVIEIAYERFDALAAALGERDAATPTATPPIGTAVPRART